MVVAALLPDEMGFVRRKLMRFGMPDVFCHFEKRKKDFECDFDFFCPDICIPVGSTTVRVGKNYRKTREPNCSMTKGLAVFQGQAVRD